MNKFNAFKNISLAATIFLIMIFGVGCADIKELNKKSIITAIAVDIKDEEVCIFTEVANMEAGNKNNSNGGGNSDKFVYVKGHGKTIPEARENIVRKLDKQEYIGAVRILIITENFAKERLVEYLYRIRADEEYRKKVITIITKDDPEKIFNIINGKNKSAGFTIDLLINSLDNQGKSFSRTTSRILENLSSEYTGILIPCIGLQNDELALIGYSVINGTKVDGFIPIQEANGVIYLKAEKPELIYILNYKDIEYTLNVKLKKRKTKASYENGKIVFDMNLEFEASLRYGNKKVPYNIDKNDIAEIERTLKGMLEKDITDTIDKAQKEFKCDYFQFDDEFRIKYPERFDEMDWASEFIKADINNTVTVNLKPYTMMDYISQ